VKTRATSRQRFSSTLVTTGGLVPALPVRHYATSADVDQVTSVAAHDVHLDPVDATEPLDPLGFLGDWLSQDNDTLAASLRRFAGHDPHSLEHLRSDLDRFPSCGDDGERLFRWPHE